MSDGWAGTGMTDEGIRHAKEMMAELRSEETAATIADYLVKFRQLVAEYGRDFAMIEFISMVAETVQDEDDEGLPYRIAVAMLNELDVLKTLTESSGW